MLILKLFLEVDCHDQCSCSSHEFCISVDIFLSPFFTHVANWSASYEPRRCHNF